MAKENATHYTYKPEEDKLVVTGKLTAFRFSTSKFSQDKEHYQISIQCDAIPADVIADIKALYFSDTKDKYLPSFIKDAEKDPKAALYINLKSQYEVPSFVEGEGNKRYGFDDVIELGDGLPPLGSTVKLSIRLKSGAAYPLAVLFTEIRKLDASDYFD